MNKKVIVNWLEIIKDSLKIIGKLVIKWLWILFLILIVLVIFTFFKFPTDISITISTSIFLIILTYDLIKMLARTMDSMEIKRLSKPFKDSASLSLFKWAEGIEIEERFFYKILIDNTNEDPIKNLNSIKRKIKNACSGNISNLKLLKAYIERRLSKNIMDHFGNILLIIIVAIITSIFNNLALDSNVVQLVHDYITKSNSKIEVSLIANIINYTTYFFILFIFVLYSWTIFTKDKQRLLLISKIIDIAIYEIETKNNR